MAYSRAQQLVNLNAVRGQTLELALYSTNPTSSDTGTEISGGAYTRKSVTFAAVVSEADGAYIANDIIVTFPQATADWSATVSHFGVRIVGGALVFFAPLTALGVPTTRTVRSGDIFQVAIGAVKHKETD